MGGTNSKLIRGNDLQLGGPVHGWPPNRPAHVIIWDGNPNDNDATLDVKGQVAVRGEATFHGKAFGQSPESDAEFATRGFVLEQGGGVSQLHFFNHNLYPPLPGAWATKGTNPDPGTRGLDIGYDAVANKLYYMWSSNAPGGGDVKLVFQFEIPPNFQGWSRIEVWTKATTGGRVDITLKDTAGTAVPLAGATNLHYPTWTESHVSVGLGNFNPGGTATLTIQLTGTTDAEAYLGALKLVTPVAPLPPPPTPGPTTYPLVRKVRLDLSADAVPGQPGAFYIDKGAGPVGCNVTQDALGQPLAFRILGDGIEMAEGLESEFPHPSIVADYTLLRSNDAAPGSLNAVKFNLYPARPVANTIIHYNRKSIATPVAGLRKLAIPAYFYPDDPLTPPLYWAQMIAAAPKVGIVIANPNSGPGATYDPAYSTQIQAAQAAGISVIGYVPTTWGARAAVDVKADIEKWYDWYYVDGIFFDEGSTSIVYIPYYTDLNDYVKAKGGQAITVINPGQNTDEGYTAAADVLVIFENPYPDYTTWAPDAWVASYPSSKFWHLVLECPYANMPTAMSLSQTRNAGWVYVTPGAEPTVWDTLPSDPYWTDELAAL